MTNTKQPYEFLITSKEQTRTGFINFALEKNRRSTPIIDSAKSLRVMASVATAPRDLLSIKEIRPALLTAAGLSDKSLKYFTENDKDQAILALIENFLEPAGDGFIEEVVYRYLLIKGDSLGGSMRNLVGAIAQQRLVRTFISNLTVMNKECYYLSNNSKQWSLLGEYNLGVEDNLKAISWCNDSGTARVLAFNFKIPAVNNNVDICLFNADPTSYDNGRIVDVSQSILMLGELKGGIDPAGADEHWKTANTALDRIRTSFQKIGCSVQTSFVAAAIERKMAQEIYNQLEKGELSYAANMSVDEQLVDYCNWIITQ